MPEITVTARGEGSYEVAIVDSGSATKHIVTAAETVVARLAPNEGPEALIAASFRFLLDREPKESILRSFDLPIISRYFPDYETSLPSYLRVGLRHPIHGKRETVEGAMRASAGIMLYRVEPGLEVLIAHPGGPFWRKRDDGAWSIPKGLIQPGEEPLAAGRREFTEETGLTLPSDGYLELGGVRQRSGKTILAWAIEGDVAPEALASNTFSLEWPPGSGRVNEYPEMDRFLWAIPAMAGRKLNRAQRPFVDRLQQQLHD